MTYSYKRPVALAIALVFIFGLTPYLPSANAADLTSCRIKSSQRENVSLGFPLRDGRLAAVKNPKIMVIPFR